MTKKDLRKLYLRKRMELSEDDFLQLNTQLCGNFFASVSLRDVSVLHTFLPIRRTREVDTWQIIDRINRQHPQIRISVPKMNNQTAELEHYYFEGRDQLKNNMWEIPEPVKGVPTPIEKVDAVLVPLLAFDRAGHRIGYGRGFYDRFLAACRPDCQKIGLSLFEMEEKIQDINEKDIQLNIVITPQSTVVI